MCWKTDSKDDNKGCIDIEGLYRKLCTRIQDYPPKNTIFAHVTSTNKILCNVVFSPSKLYSTCFGDAVTRHA